MTDHEKKNEELAQKIGVNALINVLKYYNFPTPEQMQELANTDPHLNNIPLAEWDRAAGRIVYGARTCGSCGTRLLPSNPNEFKMNFSTPFVPRVANGLSLAERVCVLKHVALFHYATKVLDKPLPVYQKDGAILRASA
jgi:hypothetical protein